MRMSSDVLVAVQSLTLGVFLAVAGIEAGAGFLDTVATAGAPLLAITFVEAAGAIVAGLALARYVWDLDWVVTAGAISGGMTSTPGLGAAIDAAGTEEVGAGYGSTYPFALIGMVIFAKLLGLGL
jgi:putative transport protein